MQTDAVNGRHPDGAGNDIFDLLQFAVQSVVGGDDLFAVVIKHLPFASQAKLLFAPLDEQRFEDALEGTDLLADGGLGDVINLGSFSKTLRLS